MGSTGVLMVFIGILIVFTVIFSCTCKGYYLRQLIWLLCVKLKYKNQLK